MSVSIFPVSLIPRSSSLMVFKSERALGPGNEAAVPAKLFVYSLPLYLETFIRLGKGFCQSYENNNEVHIVLNFTIFKKLSH